MIKTLIEIPVYIVCANEVEGNLDDELAFVKEFSTGNERILFIEEVLNGVLAGKQGLAEYLHFAFSLYRGEVNTILSKKGVSMTIVEKNIRAWNEQLGLRDEYKKEGEKDAKKHVAQKMLEKGFSLEDIMDTTELSREEVLALQK
ncbi:MAG: hypothetical protein JXJ04_26725 [Spirochaetales bacterium]|nr:hypothetical protein [Spirochaetales bacterium]